MGLKFITLLKSFFPKGQIWVFQTNFNYLIDGISREFERAYNSAKEFYANFNIIESASLAPFHAKDYLIDGTIYTNLELQRIIVEYINKDLSFKQIIEDFANFINSPLFFALNGTPVQFGDFEFADTFGDETEGSEFEIMKLVVVLDEDIICSEFKKINFLINYLKPPYLLISYINKPAFSENYIEFGRSEFPSEFGEVIQCK